VDDIDISLNSFSQDGYPIP